MARRKYVHLTMWWNAKCWDWGYQISLLHIQSVFSVSHSYSDCHGNDQDPGPEQHARLFLHLSQQRCCTQVGCGADELIDLLMRCVLEPGDCIIDTPPTFTMYAFDADINNARVITVPRMEGFAIDVPGIIKAVHEHRCVCLTCLSWEWQETAVSGNPHRDSIKTPSAGLLQVSLS